MSAPTSTDESPLDGARPARRQLPYGLMTASVLAVVLLAIALVVALSSDDGTETSDEGTTSGSITTGGSGLVAPDLTGEPLPTMELETFDGGTGSLTDFVGTPMVVNFFASWCTPCITEMPDFEAVHQELGDEVTFVGVNSTDTLDDGRAIVETTGITYELLRDGNGDLLAELGGVGMPVTFFVDADGTIVDMRATKLDQDDLRRILADELGVGVGS